MVLLLLATITSDSVSMLYNAAILLISAVLTALAVAVRGWITARVKNEAERAILDRAVAFMSTEVRSLEQTMRPQIIAAASDGKISKDELKSLRDTAIGNVKTSLGTAGVDALKAAIGDRSVDDHLSSLLEAQVLSMKRGSDGFARVSILNTIIVFVLFTIAAQLLYGCSATIRQQAINVGNSVSHVSDTESTGLLTLYCKVQMRALGHPAEYASGHCSRTDSEIPASSASPEQMAALTAVRTQWEPVLQAHERLIRAHNALGAILNGTVHASDGQLIAAIADVSTAYSELRELARSVNYTFPDVLNGGQ